MILIVLFDVIHLPTPKSTWIGLLSPSKDVDISSFVIYFNFHEYFDIVTVEYLSIFLMHLFVKN
jgi:hypothetical protein